MNSKETGYLGEKIACRFMEKRGYRLLKHNFIIRGGEIDLIMKKNQEIVFIEVKTRRNYNYGEPLESITSQQEDRIKRAAQVYLCGIETENIDIRFFGIAVMLDYHNKLSKIEIYEDIFI